MTEASLLATESGGGPSALSKKSVYRKLGRRSQYNNLGMSNTTSRLARRGGS